VAKLFFTFDKAYFYFIPGSKSKAHLVVVDKKQIIRRDRKTSTNLTTTATTIPYWDRTFN